MVVGKVYYCLTVKFEWAFPKRVEEFPVINEFLKQLFGKRRCGETEITTRLSIINV